MDLTELTLTGKKLKPRWWNVGYQLCRVLLLTLVVLSVVGFPRNRVGDVLQSSALSRSDLIETEMAIRKEFLEKDPTATDSTTVSDVFDSEGWRTLERAVDAHQKHFHTIEDERRWWDRLFLMGCSVAAIGMVIFGKLQTDRINRQWDENLPQGRQHLWGKFPGGGL
ncbi:MAG: hypothetical protein KF712_17615 [Akkermansiaceae bacterium]|nr:hypothetical protein [Akkermansiaceae bacterium]